MTFSPPPEAPHFRGKTLTPESPVPRHIPEPNNIPVLQNQIDPVFNLMSTHMDRPPVFQQPAEHQANSSQYSSSPMKSPPDVAQDGSTNGLHPSHGFRNTALPETDEDKAYALAFAKDGSEGGEKSQGMDTYQNHSSSLSQPTTSSSSAFDRYFAHPQHVPSSPDSIHVQGLSEGTLQFTAQSNDSPRHSKDNDSQTAGADGAPEEPSSRSTQKAEDNVIGEGVNYQALLDNLSPSTATAPGAENIASATTAAPTETSNAPRPSSVETPISALPLPAGLPPRPPPQEKPAIHPNYTPGEDIRSYHFPPNPAANAPNASNANRPSQSYNQAPPASGVGTNGLPPPPLATFQQSSQKAEDSQPSPSTPRGRQKDGIALGIDGENDETPWTPDAENKYETFLKEEAIYVSEGLWDRFPQGSRLFVGNLFTEKVTKRDLFYVFHRYGRIAQVSIKNAYGFIQYHDASNCLHALQAEQGMVLRGRKCHLEISKPQKNSRNARTTAAGDSLRASDRRRSRSPDYRSVRRGSNQRSRGPNFSDFRDEPGRRDAYRPMRSPSPRGYHGRDEYRDRDRSHFYGGRRSRSPSPYGRNGRYRSRSPRSRDPEDETNLPIPRRDPRSVPDVQIILVDEVDRTFVGYIEKSFRDRGFHCDVLQLPSVSLAAVIKRQIVEGVLAVVKIFRQSQVTGKIPLQVFDRSAGSSNVRYDEYAELDAHVAAELVYRAKTTHVARVQPPPPAYGAPQYGQPPLQQMPPQSQAAGGNPNLANLISSLDGAGLQKLLGAMQQNPTGPNGPPQPTPQQIAQVPDLAALLANAPRQQPPLPPLPPQQQGFSYGGARPQPQPQQPPTQYGGMPPNPAYTHNPAPAPYMVHQQQSPPFHQQPSQQPSIQSIMEQLARGKR